MSERRGETGKSGEHHPKTTEKAHLLEKGTCNPDAKNCGVNTEVELIVLRHERRAPNGRLTEQGRRNARRVARELNVNPNDYGVIQTIASYNGVETEGVAEEEPRTAETAHIIADEIVGGETGTPERVKQLEWKHLEHPSPIDQFQIYNWHLVNVLGSGEKNFKILNAEDRDYAMREFVQTKKYNELEDWLHEKRISDEILERAEIEAQNRTVEELAQLPGESARAYRREAAGAMAYLILYYQSVAEGMDPNERALIIAGTHGTYAEWVLREALMLTDSEGKERIGFDSGDEIGGALRPGEGYRIVIRTNGEGKVEEVALRFTGEGRPQGKCMLDLSILASLADDYAKLHGLPTPKEAINLS